MRLLITGVSGFLGWNLVQRLADREDFDVSGWYHRHAPPPDIPALEVNLEDADSIRLALERLQPDVVIHAAALSSPAVCEADPDRADRVNTQSTRVLAEWLKPRGGHLIFCSTDLVFDGLHAPYEENDPPVPRHAYARTKRAGEQVTLDLGDQGAVARLSLMYGDGSPASGSFLRWLDSGFHSPEEVSLFSDEYRTALYGPDAADALGSLACQRKSGIWHLGGGERLSRVEFARIYAQIFNLDASRIRPVRQAEVPGPVYRAPDVSFRIAKARQALGFNPRTTVEALQHLKLERGLG
jgi:dTDP-4-dehydrorhamnose reductase